MLWIQIQSRTKDHSIMYVIRLFYLFKMVTTSAAAALDHVEEHVLSCISHCYELIQPDHCGYSNSNSNTITILQTLRSNIQYGNILGNIADCQTQSQDS